MTALEAAEIKAALAAGIRAELRREAPSWALIARLAGILARQEAAADAEAA